MNTIVKLTMSEEDYKSLPLALRQKMQLEIVDVKDFDYSQDELWQVLNKKSKSAYKELKEREFKLRHG